jgi:hypothetical protein
MRRVLLPLLLLLALFAAVPGGASAKYAIGISDQSATTFANPLYPALHMRMARYITPWDVMKRPDDAIKLATWIAGARAAHQRILIAFEASHTRGQERKVPSRRAYTKAISAFHKAFPDVKDIQPWNEVNRCQHRTPDGSWVGQPICKKPKMAAVYYKAARKVFRGAKITGLDILDQANVKPAVRYVKAFLRYVKPRPRYWGFHNYSDTNRFSSKRTKALLKATRSGDVWLTETGGIVSFGSGFHYSQSRAAKALGCMFSIARSSRRITRLYVYQFNGLVRGTRFDAGLINPDNTRRPGFAIVQKRKARRCKR